MSVLKHDDDGGDLSLIVADSTLVVACNQGHAWTLPLTALDGDGAALEDSPVLRNLVPDDEPETMDRDRLSKIIEKYQEH
ncbi:MULTISPECIES: hypothetical protein [unclassified Pseudoclavibacter]|uniref:hypothetical protein n=1 Tax=unclassified Pseudoclavibacter TaxID=2615177 RepID=UPI001BA45394|nr:hypothetical protein [Pseudoclavibacter sp. Marseille-Q4354]MBS3178351.1 hypothetical protein [Pseudoclavibacter sp. Marseille-Q4354]